MKLQKYLTKIFEYFVVAIITYIITYVLIKNGIIANPILDIEVPALEENIEHQNIPLSETVHMPRLLDLEYYAPSDFDIPIHLDPNLDASSGIPRNSISIASIPATAQEAIYATTNDFIQTALAEKEKYMHLKNFGVDHPYVDARINYHSATAEQLRAGIDVARHTNSFMENDTFPDVLEWLSDRV